MGILPGELVNHPEMTPCPHCGAPSLVQLFPAFFRPVAAGQTGELLVLDTEASCFYHPDRKAIVPCESCGCFLCALCDCQLSEKHFCPACLETAPKKGRIRNLDNERTLYDSIALALAVLPAAVVFGVYFTFITAPLAVYVALRYWNAPRSIVGRTRVRYIVALVLAFLQIAAWGLGIYYLVFANKTGNG